MDDTLKIINEMRALNKKHHEEVMQKIAEWDRKFAQDLNRFKKERQS